MEEELSWHQTTHEGILNESTGLNTIVISGEVRQCAILQRILNTTTLNQLLTKSAHHLRDVLRRSLRARINHLNNGIVLGQALDHGFVDLRSHVLQCGRDAILQLLTIGRTRDVRKDTAMNRREDGRHSRTSLIQLVSYELLSFQVRNQIGCANREAGEQIELRNHGLDVVDQLSTAVRTEVIVDHVDEVATIRLLHDAVGQLSVLNRDVTLDTEHRKRRRDQLRASPRRVLASKRTLQASKHVHGNHLRNHDTGLSDAEDTGHGILEQLDDRRVRAGADDVSQQTSQVAQLRSRGNALRHVHVHLVTIKVCVVGASSRYIQAEG